eukprot:m.238457 g.238457  ORF g.238457 m.238457 type:complete len:337 (+) comp13303_c0_seq1:237-1247(+)
MLGLELPLGKPSAIHDRNAAVRLILARESDRQDTFGVPIKDKHFLDLPKLGALRSDIFAQLGQVRRVLLELLRVEHVLDDNNAGHLRADCRALLPREKLRLRGALLLLADPRRRVPVLLVLEHRPRCVQRLSAELIPVEQLEGKRDRGDLEIAAARVALQLALGRAVQLDLLFTICILSNDAILGHEFFELLVSCILWQTSDINIGVLVVGQLEEFLLILVFLWLGQVFVLLLLLFRMLVRVIPLRLARLLVEKVRLAIRGFLALPLVVCRWRSSGLVAGLILLDQALINLREESLVLVAPLHQRARIVHVRRVRVRGRRLAGHRSTDETNGYARR